MTIPKKHTDFAKDNLARIVAVKNIVKIENKVEDDNEE